jgi:hypothetical protein
MEFATVLQARGAFLQLLLIYLIICTVPLGLGTYLLVAPRRGGNFLNDAFAIFPQVAPDAYLKKLFYRLLGMGLVLASTFYIYQIWLDIASPVVHFLRSKWITRSTATPNGIVHNAAGTSATSTLKKWHLRHETGARLPWRSGRKHCFINARYARQSNF